MALSPLCKLILPVALVPALLAGCSGGRDPATEEPVELAAGQYRVTMQGGKMGVFFKTGDGPGSVDDSICVLPSETGEFPRNLARNYLSFHPGCSFEWEERKGNAIAGKSVCQTDGQRAPGGMISTEIHGALAADHVELDGQVKFDLPDSATAGMSPEQAAQVKQGAKLMESLTIRIKAERTGDCT
ncbi:hypothetical protein L7H23_12360 [Sphingopyxis sp. BSN-002]|uniref:DUF3617 domain-containing protein n=1 Tax=Sphingopyxis sp. BSN-002 TaxID=2911495 RepID=UPI001EDA0148|nr:DUF3617 family protein [Sphingopyxis sp. BSN-002]UKK83355.1 hypothetical protein L7H23_12360 [Sphingopyxis sp. BSN-002]